MRRLVTAAAVLFASVFVSGAWFGPNLVPESMYEPLPIQPGRYQTLLYEGEGGARPCVRPAPTSWVIGADPLRPRCYTNGGTITIDGQGSNLTIRAREVWEEDAPLSGFAFGDDGYYLLISADNPEDGFQLYRLARRAGREWHIWNPQCHPQERLLNVRDLGTAPSLQVARAHGARRVNPGDVCRFDDLNSLRNAFQQWERELIQHYPPDVIWVRQ